MKQEEKNKPRLTAGRVWAMATAIAVGAFIKSVWDSFQSGKESESLLSILIFIGVLLFFNFFALMDKRKANQEKCDSDD